MAPDFHNKKVLVMGLGLLGGGLATTKWLVKHGAKVTVTDLKAREVLKPTIKRLGPLAKKIKLVLGKHRESDFKTNDIVVVNPAVPRESKYLAIAKKSGAQIENDASLFFKFCKNPVIAVTGTRGKTTTVNWIYHLLKKKYPSTVLAGNSSDISLLRALDGLDGKTPIVVELSSWQLELLPQVRRGPHISVITNIFRDHLNRYKSLKDYALAKANIFRKQKPGDFLILNKNNFWTKFFLKLKPQSRVSYFPGDLGFDLHGFEKQYGRHNLENFSAAAMAAELAGVPKAIIRKAAKNLPPIPFREEIIFKNKGLTVVNDTTATSPDGTIAALERFGKNGRIFLITGGTDKNLEYRDWARAVKKYVAPEDLYLLNGSATRKMIRALRKIGYWRRNGIQLFENLPDILWRIGNKELRIRDRNAIIRNSKFIILFSPSAASFEKFKNEFDRGRKFNLYWRQNIPIHRR